MSDWVATPLLGGPVQVLGACELEDTPDGVVVHRLPARARAHLPDGFIRMCEEQPSGVRLRFRTTARRFALEVRSHRTVIVDRPVPAGGLYDVVVDGALARQVSAPEHGVIVLEPRSGTTSSGPAPVTVVEVDGLRPGEKDIEVWLPHAEVTRLVALRTDGPVLPLPTPEPGLRWLHHGSSISHGASAESPTGIWPVVAARTLGWDLLNLGFSGNAVLDPFTARAIRDQPADLITLKLGINVVNHDCFRRRSFVPVVHGFLDTIREGQPTTPVVVISPILCPMVEDRPGPTEIDPGSPAEAPVFRTSGRAEELEEGKLSLRVIRDELAGVVAERGDAALGYLDGLDLFGPGEWERMPMPDLLHPDAAGHRHIGERFAHLAPGLLQRLTGAGTVPTTSSTGR